MDTLNIIFLIIGGAFILAEFVLPGGIVVWLGISLLIIVTFRYFGFLHNYATIFFVWSTMSAALVFFSACFLQRFFAGNITKEKLHEEGKALGARVLVESDICNKKSTGRINFQGVTWKARSTENIISKGEHAIIVGRDNITWLVKAEKGDHI